MSPRKVYKRMPRLLFDQVWPMVISSLKLTGHVPSSWHAIE